MLKFVTSFVWLVDYWHLLFVILLKKCLFEDSYDYLQTLLKQGTVYRWFLKVILSVYFR